MTAVEKLLDNLNKMTPDEVTKAVRDALDMSGIEWTDDGSGIPIEVAMQEWLDDYLRKLEDENGRNRQEDRNVKENEP